MWYVFLFGLTILMVEERLALDQHENIYYLVSHIQRNTVGSFMNYHLLDKCKPTFIERKKNPFYYLNLFALSIPPPHQSIGLIYYLYSYYSRLFRA